MGSSLRARYVAPILFAVSVGCGSHQPPATAPRPPSASAVQELRQQLATVFNAPVMAHGVWGVEIRSLDRGDQVFSLNAGKLAMPASNMKILTLAAAAEVLGWDHRFTTTLETMASVEAGVLHGDLVIRGTGDPTISTRGNRNEAVFDDWAAALKGLGVSVIDGRIIGDDRAFDDRVIGPGWSWDYLEAGYAAPVGALQYNESTADLTVAPGAAAGDPASVYLAAGSGLTVVNRARTVPLAPSALAQGRPEASEPRVSINVTRRVDGPELEITGTIPVGAEPFRRTVAVINPTTYFVQSARDALIARGIVVTGPAVDGDELAAEVPQPDQRRTLITTHSPPLSEIAGVLMKVSQNQYAETLLKAIGAARGGVGTTAAGRRAAGEVFTAWGIPATGYVMSDGSGLSRYNYIAPSTLTTVLTRMHADPKHREPFLAALPVAGQDGTLASRMRRSRAEGNARAKTGSIANVRSLSGYVATRDGETLSFVMLANDFVTPAATVNWIADLVVEILANASR